MSQLTLDPERSGWPLITCDRLRFSFTLCVLHHLSFVCERPGFNGPPAFANVAFRHDANHGHDHALIRAGLPNSQPCKIWMVSQVSVVELSSC